ncbi:MAG: hypothetical protein E4H30_02625 [Methanomassiliicoccus sp.]|nr:MAG: hypothetical protein E4H30_02625 [Methanomassiliicoccus sp.]
MVEDLKQLGNACAQKARDGLVEVLNKEMRTEQTECIYPPMYRIMEQKVQRLPGLLIIGAADVKAEGRSRFILTLTKDTATALADLVRNTPVQIHRTLVGVDRDALMKVTDLCMNGYISSICQFIGSSFTTTPPVMTFDMIEGTAPPSKIVQLIQGYDLMLETHFTDHLGKYQGGVIYLPDNTVQYNIFKRFDK